MLHYSLNDHTTGSCQVKSRRQALLVGLPLKYRISRTWGIFHYFVRCISRELDGKRSSQDSEPALSWDASAADEFSSVKLLPCLTTQSEWRLHTLIVLTHMASLCLTTLPTIIPYLVAQIIFSLHIPQWPEGALQAASIGGSLHGDTADSKVPSVSRVTWSLLAGQGEEACGWGVAGPRLC